MTLTKDQLVNWAETALWYLVMIRGDNRDEINVRVIDILMIYRTAILELYPYSVLILVSSERGGKLMVDGKL